MLPNASSPPVAVELLFGLVPLTAGLGFGLSMVAELRGQIYAECTQMMSEYDPEPPFNAGSMKIASPNVKQGLIVLLADFSKKAEALAGIAKG